MRSFKALFLVPLLAFPVLAAVLGVGRVQAQSTLTREEAIYVGSMSAASAIYLDTMQDLSALSTRMSNEWSSLDWQNDMIAETGVLDALDAEVNKITPPSRFQGSYAEFVAAADTMNKAGQTFRTAIEQNNLDTFASGLPLVNDANTHIKQATDLIQQESGS